MSPLVRLWLCFAIIAQHFGYSSKLYFEKQSVFFQELATSHSSLAAFIKTGFPVDSWSSG